MTDTTRIDPRAAARWNPVYMRHADTIVEMRRAGYSRTAIGQTLGLSQTQLNDAIGLLLDLGRIERATPSWHAQAADRPAPRHTVTATIRGCRVTTTADSAEQALAIHTAMAGPLPDRGTGPGWRDIAAALPNLGPDALITRGRRAKA